MCYYTRIPDSYLVSCKTARKERSRKNNDVKIWLMIMLRDDSVSTEKYVNIIRYHFIFYLVSRRNPNTVLSVNMLFVTVLRYRGKF